jgi:hypothetical protein
VLAVSLCGSCQGAAPASEGAPNTANAPPAAAAPLTKTPDPAPAQAEPPAAANEAKVEKVCPFPRRCEDACKKAHFAAMGTCQPEWDKIAKAMPNMDEMGACTARCLTSKNVAGCVGAETKEECACAEKCTEGAPAALRETGEPYLACYAKAVAAACY